MEREFFKSVKLNTRRDFVCLVDDMYNYHYVNIDELLADEVFAEYIEMSEKESDNLERLTHFLTAEDLRAKAHNIAEKLNEFKEHTIQHKRIESDLENLSLLLENKSIR